MLHMAVTRSSSGDVAIWRVCISSFVDDVMTRNRFRDLLSDLLRGSIESGRSGVPHTIVLLFSRRTSYSAVVLVRREKNIEKPENIYAGVGVSGLAMHVTLVGVSGVNTGRGHSRNSRVVVRRRMT